RHLLDKFREAGFAHVMISLWNRKENVVEAFGASGDLRPLVSLTRREMYNVEGDAADDILAHVVKTGRRIDVLDCLDRRYRCDQYAVRSISPPLVQQVVVPLVSREPRLGYPESDTFGTVQVARHAVPLAADQEQKLQCLIHYAAAELERAL